MPLSHACSRTAKIWDLSDPSSPTSSEAVYTLEGATQAVWAVLLLPTSTRDSVHCLTASADKLIRLYHNASHVATFKGHEQPVRALSLIPPAAIGEEGIFASAGNDGLVKIWNWTQGSASELRTLQGHDSFVYSLATASDGTLASSGEDRTVRVWDKLTGDLTQIITIPAISSESQTISTYLVQPSHAIPVRANAVSPIPPLRAGRAQSGPSPLSRAQTTLSLARPTRSPASLRATRRDSPLRTSWPHSTRPCPHRR